MTGKGVISTICCCMTSGKTPTLNKQLVTIIVCASTLGMTTYSVNAAPRLILTYAPAE